MEWRKSESVSIKKQKTDGEEERWELPPYRHHEQS